MRKKSWRLLFLSLFQGCCRWEMLISAVHRKNSLLAQNLPTRYTWFFETWEWCASDMKPNIHGNWHQPRGTDKTKPLWMDFLNYIIDFLTELPVSHLQKINWKSNLNSNCDLAGKWFNSAPLKENYLTAANCWHFHESPQLGHGVPRYWCCSPFPSGLPSSALKTEKVWAREEAKLKN